MFRLWLVLSFFWVAIVAAIGYSNWPSSIPQTEQATGKDPKAYDPKTYVPEYLKNEDPNAYVPEFMKEDPYEKYVHPDLDAPKTDRFAGALKDFDAVKAQQSAQHLAVTMAELAFVPPALILLVGLSLGWAFRGFRPQ
jgi:hypothetical protein